MVGTPNPPPPPSGQPFAGDLPTCTVRQITRYLSDADIQHLSMASRSVRENLTAPKPLRRLCNDLGNIALACWVQLCDSTPGGMEMVVRNVQQMTQLDPSVLMGMSNPAYDAPTVRVARTLRACMARWGVSMSRPNPYKSKSFNKRKNKQQLYTLAVQLHVMYMSILVHYEMSAVTASFRTLTPVTTGHGAPHIQAALKHIRATTHNFLYWYRQVELREALHIGPQGNKKI